MTEDLTLVELIAKSRVMHSFLPEDDKRTKNEYVADELEAVGYRQVVAAPSDTDREALAKALFDADAPVVGYERRYPDEGNEDVQTGQEWRYYLPMADRLAAGFRRSPVPPETDRNAVEAEIVWVLAGAGVESSKRRTIAGHVIRSLAEAGLLAAVPPVTEEPDLPNGHAPVEQLSGFLARRVVPPVPEETVREWADYFGHHSSHVGGRPVFTGDEIAAILRGPKPFGSSRPVPEGDKR